MYRRGKGLLSLILTIAMVAANVVPVSADGLVDGTQQPVEEQPISGTEEIGTEEIGTEEIGTEEIRIEMETGSVPGQETAQTEATAEPTEAVQAEPMELNASGVEEVSAVSSSAELDDLYNKLTEDQKKFDVYSGIQPLSELVGDADLMSKLTFMQEGVTPESGSLSTQQQTIISALLAAREGDLKFYTWSEWNVWKVDSQGMPQNQLTSSASLVDAATVPLFKAAAYLESGEDSGASAILFCRPILEPVWKCINYKIPVYNADGMNTGTEIIVNADNYDTISFPENIKATSWKLIYDGTEYSLNEASEIWTKGIRSIGADIYLNKIRLQAEIEEPKYEVTGQLGKNGWYISDVIISAKDGYQIRTSEADSWSASVSVTESGAVTLYVKAADGTEQTPETLTFYIDRTAPVISGVENGQTYYGTQAAVITDDYLQAVAKNGVAVEIQENNTTVSIALDPSEEPYSILAEDMAGNQTVYTLWVKNEELPPALQDGTAEFVQPGWCEGQPKPEPVVSSVTNGIEHITYYYKVQGADDSTYTMTVPDEVGKYTAMAVFAATEAYQEVIRTSDFEILSNVPADQTAPVITGVSDGGIYYGDQQVTVTDEKLHTVTVNGEAVEISGNHADITLKPAEDVYKIIAVDEAGNKAECAVEVLETWVRDGITTDGKKKLKRERIYKLGSGQWTVDGDSTVYNGGGTFYVNNGGEYNFKRK